MLPLMYAAMGASVPCLVLFIVLKVRDRERNDAWRVIRYSRILHDAVRIRPVLYNNPTVRQHAADLMRALDRIPANTTNSKLTIDPWHKCL